MTKNIITIPVNKLTSMIKNKKVKFDTIVYVILIPSIKEYKDANIFHDVWS